MSRSSVSETNMFDILFFFGFIFIHIHILLCASLSRAPSI